MAHRAVLRQVLFVKVDQELLRLEAKLLVHDLFLRRKKAILVGLFFVMRGRNRFRGKEGGEGEKGRNAK